MLLCIDDYVYYFFLILRLEIDFSNLNCDVIDVRIIIICFYSVIKCTILMISVVLLLNVILIIMLLFRYYLLFLLLSLLLFYLFLLLNLWVSLLYRNYFENIILFMVISIVRKYWKFVIFGYVFNLAVLMVNGFY